MARNLLAAGYRLVAFDIVPERLEALVAVGDESGWRGHFARLARRVKAGTAEECWVKFPELPYFLREAREKGFPLPLTTALYEFCGAGEIDRCDNMGRPTASFWHELMTRKEKG